MTKSTDIYPFCKNPAGSSADKSAREERPGLYYNSGGATRSRRRTFVPAPDAPQTEVPIRRRER